MTATVEPCAPPVMPGMQTVSVMVMSAMPVSTRTKKRPWLEPTGMALAVMMTVPRHTLPGAVELGVAGSVMSEFRLSMPHARGSVQEGVAPSVKEDDTPGAGTKAL